MCNFKLNAKLVPQTSTPTQIKFFHEVGTPTATPSTPYTPAQKAEASFWHGNSPVVNAMPSADVMDEMTLPAATVPSPSLMGKEFCK